MRLFGKRKEKHQKLLDSIREQSFKTPAIQEKSGNPYTDLLTLNRQDMDAGDFQSVYERVKNMADRDDEIMQDLFNQEPSSETVTTTKNGPSPSDLILSQMKKQ